MGECHNLDRPEHFAVLSDSAPAVACDQPHTTETYLIGDLTSVTRFATRYPALEERGLIADLVCDGAVVRAYVGANPRQALYGLWTVAVLPTPEQWESGARWVRCDLAMVRAEDAPFEPIDSSFALRDAAASGDADGLLRCYVRDGENARDVRCSEEHDERDVNMWMPVTAIPSELEIVQRCVPSVTEWSTFTGTTADGVSGVLHTEDNGSLTLRCTAVNERVDG